MNKFVKDFIDYFITYFLLFLGYITKNLSIKNRNLLGRIFGNIIMFLTARRKRISYDNLINAFPNNSKSWYKYIIRQSFQSLAITTLELLALKYLSRNEIEKYIQYENIELINEVHSRGKGVILLSGHFGNWELLAYTAGLFTNIPLTVIVKNQKNKVLDKHLNRYRKKGGNNTVSMKNAARTIVKELRNGNAIALLADQSASSSKDIFVKFFGRKAATFESPAALALKFGSPIIMGFAHRKSDYTYNVKLIELKFDDLQNNKKGIEELTRRHVAVLEENIRLNPGLWAWQHRRWKHTIE